jgi:hypothetical protein
MTAAKKVLDGSNSLSRRDHDSAPRRSTRGEIAAYIG